MPLCSARLAQPLLVDCRSLAAESVPLDLEAAGLALIVCDTRVERGLAGAGYNDRRATCRRVARMLGVEELRDATEKDLDLSLRSGAEARQARRLRERPRPRSCRGARGRRLLRKFGRLMYASHASLRDDYEVSTPELDTFVRAAEQHGARGARLTGAGFSGCAIAPQRLEDETAAFANACERAFARGSSGEPVFYEFVPAAGARVQQRSENRPGSVFVPVYR